MFDARGMMRMATKSTLENDLRVNVSGRSFGKPSTVIYDVSALLWTISWPSNESTLGDFIVKFKSIVKHGLTKGNGVVVFDRYYTTSTKSYMRMLRQEQNGGGRVHILTVEMPLPPRTSIIGVTKNKVQLNKMLAGAMMSPEFYRLLVIVVVEIKFILNWSWDKYGVPKNTFKNRQLLQKYILCSWNNIDTRHHLSAF